MGEILTLDSRKRANLASVADHDHYVMTREPSGRIVLDPAVVLTEDELTALRDSTVWKASEQSFAKGGHHPRKRVQKKD